MTTLRLEDLREDCSTLHKNAVTMFARAERSRKQALAMATRAREMTKTAVAARAQAASARAA